MRVGVTIPAYELATGKARSFAAMVEDAIAAESLGYDSVWVMDHVFIERGGKRVVGGPEPLSFLSHVAARTQEIELGTLVLCAPSRPPAQLARELRTLQEASGGRFILGIGAGWHQPEFDAFGFPFDHLVGRFEEYMEVLTRLLGGEGVDFEGRYQVLRRGVVYGDSAPLPWVAAAGPRMLRLTGRLAGGWNGAWYGFDTSVFRERLVEVEAALQAEGRQRSELVASAGLLVLPGAPAQPSAIAGSPEQVAAAINAFGTAGCEHAILNFSLTPFAEGEPGLARVLAPLLESMR
ncbi:MAG: LLM class flavin-dependent oxidoreductase [Candidatus Dormibacteraeota bacterium]|nr:LLM class flavin-dependent oxidoreductase [Candidatus Dormibacteraeota bacterium]